MKRKVSDWWHVRGGIVFFLECQHREYRKRSAANVCSTSLKCSACTDLASGSNLSFEEVGPGQWKFEKLDPETNLPVAFVVLQEEHDRMVAAHKGSIRHSYLSRRR